MGSKPAVAQIEPDELQEKSPERPSWMVNLEKPRFFSDWKQALRACRRIPKARPAYPLRIVFTDQFVGPPLNGFEFPAVIPRGTFRDPGFFQIDGDFEDELARALQDDGSPDDLRGVHQIESGRIYLADDLVCKGEHLKAVAWPIAAILAHASGLPGHDSDFFLTSYDELAYQIASEMVTACRMVMPGISASGLAAFCLSFQASAHRQDFFRRFGRTTRAKALAGERGHPGRLADSAMYFAQRLLEKYARAMNALASMTEKSVLKEQAPSTTLPNILRKKRGRPPAENGERNRSIARVAQIIPDWESRLNEVAEALDAASVTPPSGHSGWVVCWGCTHRRHFKRHIDAAFKWCSDHSQVATGNSI